jgi:RHS repeat-associated protein
MDLGGSVVQDRLGSNGIGAYMPYGETVTASSGDDRVMFATYTRDSYTGLDYAQNRYYASTYGRFTTKDNSGKSARLGSPQTWNRYSYSSNDPVNRNDPKGLCDVVIGGITNSSSNSSGLTQFASNIGADQAFPYSNGNGTGLLGQIYGLLAGVGSVAAQALAGANASTLVALDSILQAAQDPGNINIFTFSGGAQAFASAYQYLPASIQGRINNVTYVSPGTSGTTLPSGASGTPTVVLGTGLADNLATFGTTVPLGTQFIDTPCGHDANCEFNYAYSALLQRSGNSCSDQTTFSRGSQAVEQVNSNISYWYIIDDDQPPSREEVTTSITFDQP